jgi:hypothetical protein
MICGPQLALKVSAMLRQLAWGRHVFNDHEEIFKMISRTGLDNLTAYDDIARTDYVQEAADGVAASPLRESHQLAANAVDVGDRSGVAHRCAKTVSSMQEVRTGTETDSIRRQANANRDFLRDLFVGAVVQLRSERQTRRVLQLKSISGQGGVYFFRDKNGSDTALCFTAARLSQCFREGSAMILNH